MAVLHQSPSVSRPLTFGYRLLVGMKLLLFLPCPSRTHHIPSPRPVTLCLFCCLHRMEERFWNWKPWLLVISQI